MFVKKTFLLACTIGLLASCAPDTRVDLPQKSTETVSGIQLDFDVTAGDLEETKELMIGFVSAFLSRDPSNFDAVVTDDFVWHLKTTGSEPEGTALIGVDAVVEYLNARQKRWSNVSYTDNHFYGTKSAIFQSYHVTGVDAESGAFDVNGLDMYTIKAGKIAKKDSYWKIQQAAE